MIVLIGAVVVPVSPELTWWNVFAPWAVQDLAPTLLLVTYLSRPVRAAGPLVLLFVFVSLLGSDLLLSLFGSSDTALRAVIELLDRIGLGAISVFFAIATWASSSWRLSARLRCAGSALATRRRR